MGFPAPEVAPLVDRVPLGARKVRSRTCLVHWENRSNDIGKFGHSEIASVWVPEAVAGLEFAEISERLAVVELARMVLKGVVSHEAAGLPVALGLDFSGDFPHVSIGILPGSTVDSNRNLLSRSRLLSFDRKDQKARFCGTVIENSDAEIPFTWTTNNAERDHETLLGLHTFLGEEKAILVGRTSSPPVH